MTNTNNENTLSIFFQALGDQYTKQHTPIDRSDKEPKAVSTITDQSEIETTLDWLEDFRLQLESEKSDRFKVGVSNG